MQFHFRHVPCDLCGADDALPVFWKNGTLVKKQFTIVRCRHCSFVYVDPRIVDSEIPLLYDDAYFRGLGFNRHVDRSPNAAADRNATYADVIESCAEALGTINGCKILDFGCGEGTLVSKFRAAGADALGFEPSESGRAACARGCVSCTVSARRASSCRKRG